MVIVFKKLKVASRLREGKLREGSGQGNVCVMSHAFVESEGGWDL